MSSSKRKETALATGMRRLGDVTGVGAIARAAVEQEQALIDFLIERARKAGVSEATIRKAQSMKKAHDRAATIAAFLFPWLPNPLLLRLLAGKPVDDLKAPKKTPAQGRKGRAR